MRITEAKLAAAARGISLVDFGLGEPREETPEFIRRAFADAITPKSAYPLAAGHADLRAAIAAWCERRFGAALDPATEVLPTLGSKEAIFSLAVVASDPAGGKDLVAVTTPGYPVPSRGALFAGCEVVEIPLREQDDWLPDLESLPPETLDRLAIAWINSPNNPTGAVVPLERYERYAELARRHDFLLASDEAYSEIWFGDEPPASALQVDDRTNVAVFNTLSKRSAMPGYRSGFVAGDPRLIAALARFRPNTGTAPQDVVQRAALAAWSDEAHVTNMRSIYAAKRDVMLPACAAAGLRQAGGDGGFFLWLALPDGVGSEAFAVELIERGIVVAPGALLGPGGEGYIRMALVPTLEECSRAAAILRSR